MRKNKRISITQLIAVLLVGSLVIISGCGEKEMSSAAAESSTTVNIAPAEQKDIAGSTTYSGRLKSSREVEVLPKTSERIVSLNVKEGDSVAAGQTLMTLDSSSLQASIKKAEAQLSSAQASQYNNGIALETARKNYERIQKLYDSGSVSLTDVESAKNEYDSLQSGAVEASVAEAEAQLLSAQDEVRYCNITAPVGGVVGRIDVSVGDYVTTSKTLAVISDPQELQVEIAVGEADISKISLNNQVKVYVSSISDEPFIGTVTSIASVLDASSDMYPVKISLANPDGKLKSGMYAKVSIATSSVQSALCIPLSAIIPDNGVSIVYTVNEESRAQRVEVKTGINDGTYVEITSGLAAGDQVVTLGNTLISDGSLLTTQSKEGE